MNYAGKKVAVLGLSVEGQDSVLFLVNEKAQVHCCDRRTQEELGEVYEKLQRLGVIFHLGPTYLENLTDYDICIRTPGMASFTPELGIAQKKGVTISSLTQIFLEECPGRVIGVTGTKGKGTTATLIYKILKTSGRNVYLGGNVGTPLLSKVRSLNVTDWVVLELSSFQLEDVHKSPQIGVVLSVTREHLANFDTLATNYHKTQADYIAAKKNLIRYQTTNDINLCNFDDPTSRSFAQESKAHTFFFSLHSEVEGVFLRDSVFYFKRGLELEPICTTADISLIGTHNYTNIAAAILATKLALVPTEDIKKTIQQFRGLEHRLEFVAEKNGITYYNDSAATVPDATIAAISTFTVPIILIVGGSDKGADFSELGQKIVASSVKSVILIGQMATKIEQAIAAAQKAQQNKPISIIKGLKTMAEIGGTATSQAQHGDVVLLSPACASFGMFRNYKDRGIQFKTYVQNLKA